MTKQLFMIVPVLDSPLGVGSIVRHPYPLGITTAPLPSHTSDLDDAGEGMGADDDLGEQRA